MTLSRKTLLILPFTLLIVITLGFLLPEKIVMPVVGATVNDWNKDTFWYEPWGSSGVHKGIDIFASWFLVLNGAFIILLIWSL
jgi:hypothetical protein